MQYHGSMRSFSSFFWFMACGMDVRVPICPYSPHLSTTCVYQNLYTGHLLFVAMMLAMTLERCQVGRPGPRLMALICGYGIWCTYTCGLCLDNTTSINQPNTGRRYPWRAISYCHVQDLNMAVLSCSISPPTQNMVDDFAAILDLLSVSLDCAFCFWCKSIGIIMEGRRALDLATHHTRYMVNARQTWNQVYDVAAGVRGYFALKHCA